MARDLDLQYDGLMPAGGHLFDIGAVDFSSGSLVSQISPMRVIFVSVLGQFLIRFSLCSAGTVKSNS